MTTPTTNYNWGKPIVGGDLGTWGTELNVVIDAIDAQVHTNAAVLPTPNNIDLKSDPSAPLPGSLTFKNGDATVGQQTRWVLEADTATESGGNVGSNLQLISYSDTAAVIRTPVTVTRATGQVRVNIPAAAAPANCPHLDGPATTGRSLFGSTAGVDRWELELGNATAEAGANAGSDLAIRAYSDSGVLLSTPISIARSTGKATFSAPPVFTAPAFAATCSATQSVSASTQTKLNFDTTEYNITTAFDVANHRFKPTLAGYYQFNGAVATSSSVTILFCSLFKNGVEYRRGPVVTATGVTSARVTGLVFLNGATDYVEVFCFSSAGGFTTVTSATQQYFDGVLVQAA